MEIFGYSFLFFGLLGVSPIFQSNQIVEVFNSVILKDQFLFNDKFYSDLLLGIFLAIIVSFVILGGISRIGKVASKIAPVMVLVYMATVFYLMFLNYEMIIPSFKLIFIDAFTANSVLGGSVVSIIMIGVGEHHFLMRLVLEPHLLFMLLASQRILSRKD